MAEVEVWIERIADTRPGRVCPVGARMYCTLVKPVDQWAGDMKLAVSSTFTELWWQNSES